MKKDKLDLEELELLESLENGEWQSVENLEEELKLHKNIAENTVKRDKKVDVYLSARDFSKLEAIALEFGIPAKTFISSILHQYATGKLTTELNS